MHVTDQLRTAFESLARNMLASHPAIPHEWRTVRSRWQGDRLDLICNPDTPHEVWASISEHAIAVGSGRHHDDFEDFGRGLSDADVAQEAFDRFVSLLRALHPPE